MCISFFFDFYTEFSKKVTEENENYFLESMAFRDFTIKIIFLCMGKLIIIDRKRALHIADKIVKQK